MKDALQAFVFDLRKRLGSAFIGAFIGGSRALPEKYHFKTLPSDVDLFVIVNQEKLNTPFNARHNEFGARLRIRDVPKVNYINDATVVDLIILPQNVLFDIEAIASSNAQYAIGPNLFWGVILDDANSNLIDKKMKLQKIFNLSQMIRNRIDSEYQGANKAIEKHFHNSDSHKTLKDIWHGLFWALICLQNMLLTAKGLPPTIRLQYWQANSVAKALKINDLLNVIYRSFGISKINMERAKNLVSHAKSIAALAIKSGAKNGFICTRKLPFWMTALDFFLSHEEYQAIVLPSLAVQIQSALALNCYHLPKELQDDLKCFGWCLTFSKETAISLMFNLKNHITNIYTEIVYHV